MVDNTIRVRITLEVAPGGQSSTVSGDGGTHRLCATQQAVRSPPS